MNTEIFFVAAITALAASSVGAFANSDILPLAKITSPAQVPGGVGWQQEQGVNVPQGTNLVYSDTCPDDAKVPVGNSFNPNTAAKGGLQLITSFRRITQTQVWQWEIHWPQGAPSGSRISFNIYCTTR